MLPFPRWVVIYDVVVGLIVVICDDSATPAHADDRLPLLGGDNARDFRLRESLQLLQVLTVLKVPNFDRAVSSA